MNQNPYAPPKAEVADAAEEQAARERPRQVVLAIQLAAIGYVFGLLVLFVAWDSIARFKTVGATMAGQVVGLAIAVWIYYKIYQGRNWARILWLVFTLIGFAAMPFSYRLLGDSVPAIVKVNMVLGICMSLALIWLLFFSPGKEWFRVAHGPVRAGDYLKQK